MPVRLPCRAGSRASQWLLLALWPLVAVPRPAAAQAPQTPTADKGRQIVAAAVHAMGGQLYLQINQRSGNGRLYTFDSNGNMANAGTRFWVYYRFPADERLELTKKRNVIFIYSGGKGWQITFKGVEALSAHQLRSHADASAHSLDVILKQWAQAPDTLIFDHGLTQFQQEPVEAVQFTTAQGKTATVDFSTFSHLPVRVVWRQTDPQTGGILEQSVVYGDWSSIGGIETPFTIQRYEGPMEVQQENFLNVSFAPFPDSVFTPTTRRH